MGKECTLTPSIRSESELLDLHVHRGPRPKFQETAEGLEKKQRQRQATHPEENSQKEMKDLQPIQRRIAKDLQITKLGDDQERRAKWRKTEGRE